MRIDALAQLLAIPADKKALFQDGQDAVMVVEVKRHKMRLALAVSSGGEFVLPDWLVMTLPVLAKDQGVDEATFYLSTRPIWLVHGHQDAAIQIIAERLDRRAVWERLSPNERMAVGVRWLVQQIRTAGITLDDLLASERESVG